MKKLITALLIISLLVFCVGCTQDAEKKDGTISIVTTAFPHYDFARQLTSGVDNTEITMLIPAGSEVHSYEPTPSDILAISTCDMFIFTGGESETWARDIAASSGNDKMKLVSFMDICMPDGHTSACGHDHDHDHDHDHGGDTVYDEHVWTLPLLSGTICTDITEKLCSIDAENEEKYRHNLSLYLEKLKALDGELSDITENAKRDFIVVADRFPFYHLATHYGIEYHAAYSGCSSATEPSAVAVAELSEIVKSNDVPYVFTIEFSNGKIADSVIEGTNAKALTLHSCHNVSKEDFDKGVTYCSLMEQNAKNLRKALCE